MLRQDDYAFIKAISSLHVSPALLREVRSALAARKKKEKTVVATRSRSTPREFGIKAFSQLVGKREANELISSGDRWSPPIVAQHLTLGPRF
jgi:hypothetical protein